ncbi:MAG: hypothetical protein A2W23_03635 [Planctomycetes bacterium RBG_16_43_13]|nr:MAG: hypothetical protein A2W23_03635 [Planctomycetes bacterium RBG_16_43_13]
MDLNELKRNWDGFGKSDPLWSILSSPDKKGGKWQIDDFFETGVKEITAVMEYIESLGVNISRKKALDFGCGVGRLTQALTHYFDEATGVDIASSMIEQAKKYYRYGNKCIYRLNTANDLRLFPDKRFDLIYSNIVLQHMEPRYSENYIKEFLRILAPHGLIIFQLPGKRIQTLNNRIKRMMPAALLDYYNKIRYGGTMEMFGIHRDDVLRLLGDNGGKVIDLREDQGEVAGWISYRYFVTKG